MNRPRNLTDLCTWPSGEHRVVEGRCTRCGATEAPEKAICAICGGPAMQPEDPEVDPLCPPCQGHLDRGLTIDEVRVVRAAEGVPPNDGVYEASWSYELGRWVYPDEL